MMQAGTGTTVKDKTPETPGVTLALNMLRIIDELAAVMGREIDLVQARDVAAHGKLLKQKQKLTTDYRSGMKSLAAQPDLFKQLPDGLRASLKAAAQKLTDMTERNARQLRGAVLATQGLLKTFVDLIRKEVLTKPGYKNPHADQSRLGSYSPTCKPVSVSRTA